MLCHLCTLARGISEDKYRVIVGSLKLPPKTPYVPCTRYKVASQVREARISE